MCPLLCFLEPGYDAGADNRSGMCAAAWAVADEYVTGLLQSSVYSLCYITLVLSYWQSLPLPILALFSPI